jgi:hypothetical protein
MRATRIESAPPLQLREMKRAFFAGARAYSGLIMRFAESGAEPTDNDMAFMEALEAEMSAFARDVSQGLA